MKYLFLFLLLSNVSFGEDFVLNFDLQISANKDHVDLPVITRQSEKIKNHIGYGIYLEDWSNKVYMTRIHIEENKNDLFIKKNTKIILSGKHEIEKTSSGLFAHKFYVLEPKEIKYIACGVYEDHYRSLLGENERLISRSFPKSFK